MSSKETAPLQAQARGAGVWLAWSLILAACACSGAAPVREPGDGRVVVGPVASGRIEGQVVVGRGGSAAPHDAELVVTLHSAGDAPSLTSRTGEEGGFFFGPVPPGAYELVVEGPSGTVRHRESVRVGDDDAIELTIELPQPAE